MPTKKQEMYSKGKRESDKNTLTKRERGNRKVPFNDIERRSEPRRTYHLPIKFTLKGQEDEVFRGAVNNISMSGIGMFSFQPLSEGQEIIVKSSLPGKHIAYAVRWSKKLVEDFYEVGLKMIE